MNKKLALMPCVMGLLLLAGCGAPVGLAVVGGGGMYATKRDGGPPADPTLQMAPHESWCYHTLGEEVECFAEPQDTPPGRLVNVDPPNRYPLTARAYRQDVADSQKANAPPEPPKPVVDVLTVQPAEIAPLPQDLKVTTKPPVKKHLKPKPKLKHHKKTVATKPLPKPVPNPTPSSSLTEPPDLTLDAPGPSGAK